MYRTTLKIDGMGCQMYESHVNESIRNAMPDIKSVRSSYRKKTCEIMSEHAPSVVSAKAALVNTGYTVTGFQTVWVEKNDSLLTRLRRLLG